jgi:hypothetical protein
VGTVTLLDGTDEADAAQRSPEPEPKRHSFPSTKKVTIFAIVGAVVAAWWRCWRRS